MSEFRVVRRHSSPEIPPPPSSRPPPPTRHQSTMDEAGVLQRIEQTCNQLYSGTPAEQANAQKLLTLSFASFGSGASQSPLGFVSDSPYAAFWHAKLVLTRLAHSPVSQLFAARQLQSTISSHFGELLPAQRLEIRACCLCPWNKFNGAITVERNES